MLGNDRRTGRRVDRLVGRACVAPALPCVERPSAGVAGDDVQPRRVELLGDLLLAVVEQLGSDSRAAAAGVDEQQVELVAGDGDEPDDARIVLGDGRPVDQFRCPTPEVGDGALVDESARNAGVVGVVPRRMTRVLIAVDETEQSVVAARTAYKLFGEDADYTVINVAKDAPVYWGDDPLGAGFAYPLAIPPVCAGGMPSRWVVIDT